MALPEPELGLVISYSYLWRQDSEAGLSEGTKDRPCAIVLIVRAAEGESAPVVTVAPITHLPPRDPSVAIEIPARVKQHLGLDDERSWIVLDDYNEFAWPGFDLRPISSTRGRYDYGFLPPALFDAITRRILDLRRQGRGFSAARDE